MLCLALRESPVTLGCSLVLLKRCVLISNTARQNCRYDRYCSAFGDVDASFGSLGSFFSPRFAPTRGCFEANPPFVPILMQHMVDKMESLLAAASASGGEAAGGVGGGGLTFVVIVPAWTQLPFWKALEESSWLRAPVLQVPAAEHGFCDGAQVGG